MSVNVIGLVMCSAFAGFPAGAIAKLDQCQRVSRLEVTEGRSRTPNTGAAGERETCVSICAPELESELTEIVGRAKPQ
jgi:hypothetical protein